MFERTTRLVFCLVFSVLLISISGCKKGKYKRLKEQTNLSESTNPFAENPYMGDLGHLTETQSPATPPNTPETMAPAAPEENPTTTADPTSSEEVATPTTFPVPAVETPEDLPLDPTLAPATTPVVPSVATVTPKIPSPHELIEAQNFNNGKWERLGTTWIWKSADGVSYPKGPIGTNPPSE